MFVAGTDGWCVRSLESRPYPLFAVWESGPQGRFLGIAGGRDGLAELFGDIVQDVEKSMAKTAAKNAKKSQEPKTYRIAIVRYSKNGNAVVKTFTGIMTPDGPEDFASFDKGFGNTTRHHIVIQADVENRKPERNRKHNGRSRT
jgi:hypothetical protein